MTSYVAVGLNRLCGSRAHGRMGIVTYHRTAPCVRGLPAPMHNVTPDRFRAHVVGLLKRGYDIRPLEDLLRASSQGKRLPPRTIALTFDDGFESVYTHAWPVLRELGVPATIFLATGYLGTQHPFPFDLWGQDHFTTAPPFTWRPLSLAQCHEMADDGLIAFGAHTHTHRDLRGRPDELYTDLQRSVDIVREEFALQQVTFAFPYGSPHLGFAGSTMADAARRTGVICGLTTDCTLIGPDTDPFAWGRFNAFSWDTAETLSAKLSGWYTWAAQLKRRIRPSKKSDAVVDQSDGVGDDGGAGHRAAAHD
jgi:peptidoglycan/xylan/chitin deacetylase (PgdA/CDA1 family)